MASRSKRRQQINNHDEDEEMDVDGDNEFSEKHQLLLQYLMHTRMAKKIELSKVHGKLFNSEESLSDTISAISQKINPLKMDIKPVTCDITGEGYYVVIHTTGDSFFPRCCIFSKNQLAFLKQVLTGIVLSIEGKIGKIQALNSCQVLSKSEAEVAIEQFIQEKIITETSTGLCLSPLAIVEFEPFLSTCLEDNLSSCDLCIRLVFVGKACNGCNQKFHFHCVTKWLNSKRSECPKCHQFWSCDMQSDTD